MGIFCEINLCTPADGRYIYQPGSIISGGIRYYIDQQYDFFSITVSLKGRGHLHLEDLEKRNNNIYTNDEIYVDLDNVIFTNEKAESPTHPVGQYDTQFSFQLPYDIPESLEYKKRTPRYRAKCYVKYRIRIKFERPKFFRMNKKYEKVITVGPGQTPRFTTEPLVYGDQKSLLQLKSLFSNKKGVVNLKAVIANSVLKPGECVKVDYEITNDSNKTIKNVKVKLSEVDQYTAMGGLVAKVHTDVEALEGIKFKHEAIAGGETVKFTVELMIPEYCASIDNCKFLSRDYSVMTVVRLPAPHINVPLEIPFQVIKTLSSRFDENACLSNGDLPSEDPPTYWEAMSEDMDDSWETKGSKGDNLFKEEETDNNIYDKGI